MTADQAVVLTESRIPSPRAARGGCSREGAGPVEPIRSRTRKILVRHIAISPPSISKSKFPPAQEAGGISSQTLLDQHHLLAAGEEYRSEERRVGKECRSR